ncbi:hypothetical protein KCP71_09385 [Salmonella enterica subsp. enterica]|nr:hypothetical protein KCP71_09385 [Salmonella enterica subsp. enterica]
MRWSLFLGNSLMFIFGAAGAAAVGQADISDVMMAQGLLLPAIVVLGLNIWTATITRCTHRVWASPILPVFPAARCRW